MPAAQGWPVRNKAPPQRILRSACQNVVSVRSSDAAAILVPALLATVGRLRLLCPLRDVTGCPRNLSNAAFKIGGLIDRFGSQPREFLGIFAVAVFTRLQRHGQQPRSTVAQSSGMVIPVGHRSDNDRFAGFVA